MSQRMAVKCILSLCIAFAVLADNIQSQEPLKKPSSPDQIRLVTDEPQQLTQDQFTPARRYGLFASKDDMSNEPGCMNDIECLYCCKNMTCLNKKSCDQEWEKVNSWAFYQVFYTIGMQIILLTVFLVVSIMFKNKKNSLLKKLSTEGEDSKSNLIEDDSSRKNTYFIA